jgi:hypothetical protein
VEAGERVKNLPLVFKKAEITLWNHMKLQVSSIKVI